MDTLQHNKLNLILKKVSVRITPGAGLVKKSDIVVSKINSAIRVLGIDAECIKGGSIAKNTFLKDDHDVDLFVRFSLNYPDEKISDMLSTVLEKTFPKKKIRRVHGSRDYFQFSLENLEYEIIPVAKIHLTSMHESRNITDFSPFHVQWVESKINYNKELSDEIRLAKMFCKAAKVYGAESYIKGFSGHIIDILVIYYGSFLNLVKKFSSIDPISKKNPLIVDPEKHLKDPLKELNESKISPIIIVDPIQKERNAAAALSDEKIVAFIAVCRSFLESPSEKFFEIKKFSLKDLNIPQGHEMILIDIKTLDGSKDVVGTKILKVYQNIIEKSRTYGFVVEDSGWDFDYENLSAVIYLVMPKAPLSEYVGHPGPPVRNNDAYKRFCEVHKGEKITIKNHRVYAQIKRSYTDARSYIKNLLSQEYLSSRFVKATVK